MASIAADKRKSNPKSELIMILDDLDFSWTKREIQQAIFMWTSGYSIVDMAKKLRPHDSKQNGTDEVALLIMHLGRQEKIEPREGGVFGNGQ